MNETVSTTLRSNIVRTALLFATLALVLTLHGFLPGRVLVPLDILRDMGAWKPSDAVRIRVSNSLLSDVVVQFIPWDTEVVRHITRGEFPWTNRYADSAPLFANPQTALLSPFTWPRLVDGLDGWAWCVFLKIFTASLGMYWFATSIGATPLQARISGCIYVLSGYFTVWALYPHTNVFAVLPLMAAAATLVARAPTSWRIAALGIATTVVVAGGHPETALIGLLAVLVYVGATEPHWRECIMPIFAGCLLIAIVYIPFTLILLNSYEVVKRGATSAQPFRVLSIPSLAIPGLLGSPLRRELDLTGAIPRAVNFHQRVGAYIGFTVLLALLTSMKALKSKKQRMCLIIAVVGLILSWSLPGLSWAMQRIPVLSWIACDYYAAIFVLFASAVAGIALTDGRIDSRRTVLVCVAAAGAILTFIGCAPVIFPRSFERAAMLGVDYLKHIGLLHQSTAIYQQRFSGYLTAGKFTALRRLAAPGTCWIIFSVAALRGHRSIVIFGALAELFLFGYAYSPSVSVADIPSPPRVIADLLRADPLAKYLFAAPNDILPPNIGTLYKARDVRSYDVLASRQTIATLMLAGYDDKTGSLPDLPNLTQIDVLRNAGVRWIFCRLQPPGTKRVGGEPPLGVGLYAIPNPRQPAAPINEAPRTLFFGAIVSIGGAVLLTTLCAAKERRRKYDSSAA